MKLVKVGAAALNQTPLDWDGNKKNIINAIHDAIADQVDILCLPELCITGYNCEDAFFMPHVAQEATKNLFEIIAITQSSGILFTLGLPVVFEKTLYNCIAICGGGILIALIPKQNLCADGVHYENRWFKPWTQGQQQIFMYGSPVPFGDYLIDHDGVRIGIEICEDAWVSNRPGIKLAEHSVDIILNPSASHFAFGKNSIRTGFIKEGSRAFKCAYVYSNLLGNESGRTIYDGSTFIANGGHILVSGPQLSFQDHTLVSAVIDVEVNLARQLQNASHKGKSNDMVIFSSLYGQDYDHKFKHLNPIQHAQQDDFEVFSQAVALGLFDYMRKTKSKGFVVSLSGGADSAAVSLLIREMVIRSIRALGTDEVLEKLSLSIDNAGEKTILKNILTCVYQATENSSETTRNAAQYLASNIGCTFSAISVQTILDEYTRLAEEILNRKLSWESDDISLQNIQARVRAPSVWFIANVKNALLLSTSNRSEAAVGYATMDGDTCGGLSPIAGVSKEFILAWLKDYESCNLTTDFDGLRFILNQKPTAELRPSENNQTDEDDLMPYSILNKIEVMAVRDKMSPNDIYEVLITDTPKAAEYVVKFFKLFCRNQWKRERYAPGFHLDDESLDPKTFYRFPILNSNFEYELQVLKNLC